MSKNFRIKLDAAANTDQGRERKNNQDSIFQWISDPELHPPRALLLVADGMGGHQGGEVASQITIDRHKEILQPELEKEKINNKKLKETMLSAVHEANQSIFEYAVENNILPQDIGTTLDCVVVIGSEVLISHVGDGRVYLLAKNGLRQLTEDHSAVAEMVEAGIITSEEVYTHPQRNILTKGLGGISELEVKIKNLEVSVGERILLCSDGLWGLVRNPLLERILLWASPPHVLVKELIVAANEAGGDDNISAIVCDILPG